MIYKKWALTLGLSLALISNGVVFGQTNNIDNNVYKKGMENEDVKIIQQALKKDGVYTHEEFTTYFGDITEAAVISFQKKYDLPSDGVIGEKTVEKMEELGLFAANNGTSIVINFDGGQYKKGMHHENVEKIQRALSIDGVYEEKEFTTYFGPITENAVKAFQKKYEINPDGVVGIGTLNKMKSLGLIDFTVTEAVSRGTRRGAFGEYLDWWKQVKNKLIKVGAVVEVQDVETGSKFKIKVTYGTNHADVEAASSKDTEIIKKIWGGEFSWERRPVLVKVGNRTIAGSMNAMPHAGREKYPEGKYISNRSGGFGKGYNFDTVKGNAMEGVICLHFKNSLLHKNNKQDPKHQAAVKKAAGK
ncbi:peptidoglycan-binding protein [Wukongibacter baidiensis]|uniref:peptidoglycan-binding domain-containing protein n=1 Tax=Wukongibacter baidiensis TaxID=1723361 RepID=UPI003D7FA051